MKDAKLLTLMLGLIAAVAIALACSKPPPPPPPTPTATPTPTPLPERVEVQEGISQGILTATAEGIDVANMTVSVQCPFVTTIVIPTGTLFVSGAGSTQNMMSARSQEVSCSESDVGKIQTVEVEVYCMNHFKDAPTGASTFTVSSVEETDPIRKLVNCLEQIEADHNTRQGAVWLVSENYLDMTRVEVVEKLANHYAETLQKKLDQNPAALIRELRETHPENADQTDEEILAALKNNNVAVARVLAERQVKRYQEEAGPLLDECDFDTATKKFFQVV